LEVTSHTILDIFVSTKSVLEGGGCSLVVPTVPLPPLCTTILILLIFRTVCDNTTDVSLEAGA
jgi:hypothetical protein